MAGKSQAAAKPTGRMPGMRKEEDQEESERVPSNRAPQRGSQMPRPIFSRSDFEIFIENSVGHRLDVYARGLFDGKVASTYAPMDGVPVPADYVIGPGDEIVIRVWGKIEFNVTVTVDRNGQISLPKSGTIGVAGLHYAQLESYLRAAIGTIYKDFELNVTLGRLRSIQVFVLGNARQPGEYTVSSLSTLVNALFASGGPSATGSMRQIQLRRGDRILTEFDIYDLQQKGDKSHDVPLLGGDVIYIPTVGPQVAIDGNVQTPGIFELKGSATVASLVEAAGGLTNLAAPEQVILERIENRKRRLVEEFALDASGIQRALRDGDLLRISSISPRFDNAVTLRGNVSAAGHFPWREGMRIADLIPSRDSLITRGHWIQLNHLADNPSREMMADLAETDAEINWDYATIERLDERDLSTRLIPFNLGSAIDHSASADNQLLKAGDVVTVFSRKDLPLPLEKHATFVKVDGEVNAPGVYRVKPGDTLRDVVAVAGGLTRHSYLYASQLTRASVREVQEEQMKLALAQMEKQITAQYATAARPNSQIVADQEAQLGTQQALIAQLSAVRPSGRVVLGIKPDAKQVTDLPDFPLEDGDSFYVPPQLGTVQVLGEVYNENAFRYQTNKRLHSYLDEAGGPTRVADERRTYLIRADGTVVGRQRESNVWPGDFENMILMPGDAIVIPPKLKAPNAFMTDLAQITQVLSQTALTGAVVSLAH
jgi:protein involved in polysaccharide export with SLBB domain